MMGGKPKNNLSKPTEIYDNLSAIGIGIGNMGRCLRMGRIEQDGTAPEVRE
jgi:hypothetical protein